mmetsp:Transcript_15137/g.17538  ORF Transcript_15137/g.17538 Transcript_15137/m.17538 type:complete len:80 (-) Transcript_15137:4-243(-)
MIKGINEPQAVSSHRERRHSKISKILRMKPKHKAVDTRYLLVQKPVHDGTSIVSDNQSFVCTNSDSGRSLRDFHKRNRS